MTKKAFVKSYGCQMNVYDSERMGDILEGQGYQATDRMEEADVVILNTCHIREKAAEKVYSELGRVREIRDAREQQGFATKVIVAGCVAQAEGKEILRRARVVDAVVGPQSYQNLPEILKAKSRITDTEFADKFEVLPSPSRETLLKRGVSAFLTVQEGCDKFCSFCVVPYTRGAEYSRPASAILEEARKMAAAGVREITLIGQNVNAYHGEGLDGRDWTLARLLREVAQIEGIVRLRYTTSHPRDMDEDLIEAHADLPELMPYLHLPVQSGSDPILKAMNRGHTGDDYRRLIEKVRRKRPDIALSSDFIVGFPGESDADFEETIRLARDIGFASSFSFKYSSRPGTPAAEKADQVEEAVKADRLARLQQVLEEQRQGFNRSMLGQSLSVLLEKPGRDQGQVVGKSPYLQPVHMEASPLRIGDVVDVEITAIGTNSLKGELTEGEHFAAA